MTPDPAITAEVLAIAGSPRNRDRPVVLCEGETRLPRDPEQRPSPQRYRQCARYPDASFYRKCVPPDWVRRRPVFYNCGGRGDVFAIRRGLLALHARQPDATTVDVDRLFALVDLDLSPQPLDGDLSSVEDVHRALYTPPSPEGGVRLVAPQDPRHRIWVTALIHKEAYFIRPAMGPVLADAGDHVFDDTPLVLRDLHARAAERLRPGADDPDAEFQARIDAAMGRLHSSAQLFGLVTADGETLARSWLTAAAQADALGYAGLVDALFSITKAKPLWERVGPDPGIAWTRSDADWRGTIELKLAEHIAHLAPHEHPIAGFMDWLRRHG